jgi:hypothetical protein
MKTFALALVLVAVAAQDACECDYVHTDFQCDPPFTCDLEPVYHNVSSAEECGQICLKNEKCQASAWNGAGEPDFTDCYLKSGDAQLKMHRDYITTSCICRGAKPWPTPFPPIPSGQNTESPEEYKRRQGL